MSSRSMHMKKSLVLLSTLHMVVSITGCKKEEQSNKQETKEVILENYSIHRDEEFGGAYIDISIQDFNNLGFKFGDSVVFD